jgi:hypothetical protein
MVVNDNACCLNERGACWFFASKLAPAPALRVMTALLALKTGVVVQAKVAYDATKG